MTREETKQVFKRIKANYDNFSDNKDKLDEWAKIYQNYSFSGVSKNFDNWLKEGNTEAPIATQLVNEFIRVEQKESRVFCKYCRKSFEISKYEEYENHVARHNSIIYIKKREHLINKNFNEDSLMKMTDERFREFYETFQNSIVDLVPDLAEKKRLQNCILTRDGGEIELTPELYQKIGGTNE